MNQKRIFKYELGGYGEKKIPMPKGAQVLSVQNQKEVLVLWALVDEKAPKEERSFIVAHTGSTIRSDNFNRMKFLASVQFDDGDYVLHVFREEV